MGMVTLREWATVLRGQWAVRRCAPVGCLLAAIWLLAPLVGFAEDDFCAEGLAPDSEKGSPYENYPGSGPTRCEGEYSGEVSATGGAGLRIGSLIAGDREVEGDQEVVTLSWQVMRGATDYFVRSEGFAQDLYRMDTRVADSDFEWPLARLRGAGRKLEQMGLLAWTPLNFPGKTLPVYMPVRIDGTEGSASSYEMDIEPDLELRAVYSSVATVDEAGDAKDFLSLEELRVKGPLEGKTRITLTIPFDYAPGIYRLVIAGPVEESGNAIASILICHHAC